MVQRYTLFRYRQNDSAIFFLKNTKTLPEAAPRLLRIAGLLLILQDAHFGTRFTKNMFRQLSVARQSRHNMEMETEYYIASGGTHLGPFSKEMLRTNGITRDTLVWHQGMPEWRRAGDVVELADILNEDPYSAYNNGSRRQAENVSSTGAPYFAMFGNNRVGPETPDALVRQGLRPETPVWRDGMPDWAPASTQPELMEAIRRRDYPVPPANGYDQAPAYPSGYPSAGPTEPPYNRTPRTGAPTNWLPWAIVGTVIGLGSCLGMIFGIIGIVQANKANNLYASGYDREAEMANSNAKTMTIISLVIGGLAILGAISSIPAYLGILSSL